MPDRSSERQLALQSAAVRSIAHQVKKRARLYASHPFGLESLYPGLSSASSETLLAIAAHLVERETRSQRRWFGFGGEVTLLNAKAALLLGRARRRRPLTAKTDLAIAAPEQHVSSRK